MYVSRLLAALSFIIAARPWQILYFVREAGTRFLSQASQAVSGSEPGSSGQTREGEKEKD